MRKLLLKAEKRDKFSGSVKALRNKGKVPAVFYGPHVESLNLFVNLTEIEKLFRVGVFTQFLLDLNIDGVDKKVTIKEVQRCPVTSNILHIDFYQVVMDKEMKISVPIFVTGDSKGVELGGMLQIAKRNIDVFCLPASIPEFIPIDITDLDIGNSVHIKDIVPPSGVRISKDTNFTILSIISQKVSVSDEVIDEAEEEIDDSSVSE